MRLSPRGFAAFRAVRLALPTELNSLNREAKPREELISGLPGKASLTARKTAEPLMKFAHQ